MRKFLLISAAALFFVSATFAQVESAKNKKENTETRSKKKGKSRKSSQVLTQEELNQIYNSADSFKEEKDNGSIDWTNQYIEANGESVIDTVRFKNKAQARAMAIRGAVVVAQRNLLEIINGVKIHGETTVEDMIATNDYIYSRVDGVIKGAEMVGEPKEEWGMMKVTLKAPLYQENGLAPAVYDVVGEQESTEKSTGDISNQNIVKVGKVDESEAQDIKDYVFKLTGGKFDPSLFPVIVDENNNVLLDLYKIYDPKKGEFPKIMKAAKSVMESFGFEKGVETIDVIDSFDGKLVVSDKVKRKINWDNVAKTMSSIGKMLLLFI